MVYSTCSINPIENEAVIHRLLCETSGALELVDVSDTLPGLKFNPGKIIVLKHMKINENIKFLGMENWLVSSRNLEFYKTFDEVDEKWKTTIRPQMFPPKPEDRVKFHLNRWYFLNTNYFFCYS